MNYGPDIAIVAQLMGDTARSKILMALMSGHAISAARLADEAGIAPATASGHLGKLVSAGILSYVIRGRHRDYSIANRDVASAVEALIAIATRAGHLRDRPGPRDMAMRRARSCYDHLAGQLAVELFDRWMASGWLAWRDGFVHLTGKGREFLIERMVEIEALERSRRPLCRACIDWSERKHHLGGAVGAAVLGCALQKGWASQRAGSRTVAFTALGERAFVQWSSP